MIMDKDAYYFPHFCNARNDRKIRRLRKELGVEGYGIYFMVLEVLREQKEFRYPMEDIDLLADEFRTSDQKVRVVICNYDLFQVDDNERFFSPKFIEYLTPYLEKKQRNRINGIKGNLIKYNHATKSELSQMTNDEILALNASKGVTIGGESGGESQGDRNKRKVKESKANESKETNYRFESFWDDYDKKKERAKCETKWKKVKEKDRELIKEFIPIYKNHQPDKQYRKNPSTFLNNKIWKDDWNEYTPENEPTQTDYKNSLASKRRMVNK